MTAQATRYSAVAIVIAAWLTFAVWAVIRAARARVQAEQAQAWGMRLRGLLLTSPGGYLLIGSQGDVSCSEMLRGWLNIDRQVSRLDDLQKAGAQGLDPRDFKRLAEEISAVALTGEAFALPVQSADGRRFLVAQGRAAPVEVAGAQGVIVWFNDATDTVSGLGEISMERDMLARELAIAHELIDRAPLPIWRRDESLKLVQANEAYAHAVEAATPAQAVASGAELALTSYATSVLAQVRQAAVSGERQSHEDTVIIAGERRHLKIIDQPMSNGGTAGFAVDITERQQLQDWSVRLAKAQLETLDRLSAGVARFSADRSLSFHNRAFAALFHLDHDWLEQAPEFDRVLERMREMRRLPEQRDFPGWRRERRAWITDILEPVEETWALPDNTIIRVIAQPHPSGGLLLIFEDRTEQLRLESARDTQLRVHVETLNNLHEAVAVFGVDGCLELCNTPFEQMWSLPADAAEKLWHVNDIAACGSAGLGQASADVLRETVRDLTARRVRREGRLETFGGRVFDYGGVPLPDGNMLLTWVDVTDSMRIENALRERSEALETADRLKSAFVANMSYELRTPLTAITGFAEMLAAGYAGALNGRQDEYVGSILTSASRLRLLIDDVLDLATAEAGGIELAFEDIDVADLVNDAAATMRVQAEGRRLTLDVQVSPGAGNIRGDRRRLSQALHNVLSNAIRFTEADGRVLVRADGDASGVSIMLSDDGIGIEADEQQFVFDRFRKGSNATSGEGLGLGLSLVRQFVAMHGGDIKLESTVGAGTTVTIRLWRNPPVTEGAA